MTLLLPDGSPWTPPREGMAEAAPKAAVGTGVSFVTSGNPMLHDLSRSPQKLMLRAQHAYRTNPWIGTAEALVTRKVVGLPWHFEDPEGEAYEEDDSKLDGIHDLLDNLSVGGRKLSWLDFESLISRHTGLCGMAYIYLDQMEALGRTPLGLIYVNPSRVWPAEDDKGNLTGWVLDAQDSSGRGGTPYSIEELIPFYLDQPDFGHIGIGLYERLMLKAQVSQLGDQHAAYVLGTGGRIAGIVSPKEGTIPDEKFQTIVREFRNVNEAPDAAKRTTVMQNPVDFTPTAGDAQELDLVNLMKATKEDIFTGWGIPVSQAPSPSPQGMNSGDSKGFDEAVLMQGVVHDRVQTIRETFQLHLWKRYAKVGLELTMVIEEPSFDDESPAYERAAKAINIPLTVNERRDIVGKDPIDDYDTNGEPLGTAIYLASTLTEVAEGPDQNGKLAKREKKPEPPPPPDPFAPVPLPAKAGPLRGLRYTLDQQYVPRFRKSVEAMLHGQRNALSAKLRSISEETLKRHKNDPDYWWNDTRERTAALQALRPEVAGLSEQVVERVSKVLPGAKAGFSTEVERFVIDRVGDRITGINETTRLAVVNAILAGFEQGESPAQVADRIDALPAFGDARAELIARTETMNAYNAAALRSYQEYGVERVQAIDGDDDEVCAARDGQEYTLEEAMGIEDHPNGTLDWAPAKAAKPDPMLLVLAELAKARDSREPINVTVINGDQKLYREVVDYAPDGTILGSHMELDG